MAPQIIHNAFLVGKGALHWWHVRCVNGRRVDRVEESAPDAVHGRIMYESVEM